MPKGGSTDIPHVSNTDHWIRVPVKHQQVNAIRRFAGLACINNTQPSDRSRGEAFLSYFEKFSSNEAYLDSAEKYFSRETKDSIRKNIVQLVRLEFLRENYERVKNFVDSTGRTHLPSDFSVSNTDAWNFYRVGESYYQTGDVASSVEFYTKAVELAPYIAGFRSKLAGAQQDLGQPEEARQNYEFLLKENPDYVWAYVNYGYLMLSAYGNVSKANSLYDKALRLDPDNIQAWLNKAGAAFFSKDAARARIFLREVLKRDSTNAQAIKMIRILQTMR
jgi:tetratricopeptide (TPR) repeat protein